MKVTRLSDRECNDRHEEVAEGNELEEVLEKDPRRRRLERRPSSHQDLGVRGFLPRDGIDGVVDPSDAKLALAHLPRINQERGRPPVCGYQVSDVEGVVQHALAKGAPTRWIGRHLVEHRLNRHRAVVGSDVGSVTEAHHLADSVDLGEALCHAADPTQVLGGEDVLGHHPDEQDRVTAEALAEALVERQLLPVVGEELLHLALDLDARRQGPEVEEHQHGAQGERANRRQHPARAIGDPPIERIHGGSLAWPGDHENPRI
jgi:hypothetical protein